MFNRMFGSSLKFATRLGINGAGIGLISAATAVAVSESDFKKRPSWYQETVKHLEHVIRELSLKSYIEDPHFVDSAIDILQRVENVNNCEISWRLGRALTEKANLIPFKKREKKIQTLEKGIKYLEKALQLESGRGIAGLHKWYAIALMRLHDVDAKNPHAKNAQAKALSHLEKAIQLDPNDAITFHQIGFYHFRNNNLEEAIKNLRKSEELMPNFSLANQAYLGMALGKMKKKEEAKSAMKKALSMQAKNRLDKKAKADARKYSQDYLGMSNADLSTVIEY